MRTTFQEELDVLESTLQEEGALVLRALRGALNGEPAFPRALLAPVLEEFRARHERRRLRLPGRPAVEGEVCGQPSVPGRKDGVGGLPGANVL